MRKLASDGGRDPLAGLIEREDRGASRAEEHYCLATTWVRLLEHFDSRMLSVADHLLVSLGHAYRCARKAKRLASTQSPVPGKTMPASFLPGPCRTFRMLRTPEQLTLDFREQLSPLEEATSPKPSQRDCGISTGRCEQTCAHPHQADYRNKPAPIGEASHEPRAREPARSSAVEKSGAPEFRERSFT